MYSERNKYENLIRENSNYSFIDPELKKPGFCITKGGEFQNKVVELNT